MYTIYGVKFNPYKVSNDLSHEEVVWGSVSHTVKILVVAALEADEGEREGYLTVSLLTMPKVDLTERW